MGEPLEGVMVTLEMVTRAAKTLDIGASPTEMMAGLPEVPGGVLLLLMLPPQAARPRVAAVAPATARLVKTEPLRMWTRIRNGPPMPVLNPAGRQSTLSAGEIRSPGFGPQPAVEG